MATGFQSNQAKSLTHTNTHSPRYASVAEFMDTVNTVDIVHIIADISFRCERVKWEEVKIRPGGNFCFPPSSGIVMFMDSIKIYLTKSDCFCLSVTGFMYH